MADETYVWSGYASAVGDEALFTLKNTDTSAALRRYLTLRELRVRPVGPNPFYSADTTWDDILGRTRLVLTTAPSASGIDGDEVPAAAAMTGGGNSTLADLGAANVTIRSFATNPGPNDAGVKYFGGRFLVPPPGGNNDWFLPAHGRRFHSSDWFLTPGYGAGTRFQKIRLNAGQALHIARSTPTLLPPWAFNISFVVIATVGGNSATFFGTAQYVPTVIGQSSLAFMVPSGSSVTLDIVALEVEFTDVFTTSTDLQVDQPVVRYCYLRDATGGEVVGGASLSTSNVASWSQARAGRPWAAIRPRLALPGGLSLDDLGYAGSLQGPSSTNQQATRQIGTLHREVHTLDSSSMGGTGDEVTDKMIDHLYRAAGGPPPKGVTFGLRGNSGGIVLRPGECFGALMSNNPMKYCYYAIDAVWTASTNPPFGVARNRIFGGA